MNAVKLPSNIWCKLCETFTIETPYAETITLAAVDGEYISSLQLLLHGHSPGSAIWWRWRTAAELRIGTVFIGAFKIMLGGGLNMPIYWGIRTPTETSGLYATDHKLMSTQSNVSGIVYDLTFQGKSATGPAQMTSTF